MTRLLATGVLITLFACDYNPAAEVPIRHAAELTRKYAAERLRADAAGNDCQVLLVRAKTPLHDSTVETIHYGTGEPGVYRDGIQQFADERRFRAVAYRDSEGRLWTYGAITRGEAASMETCR